MSNDLNLNLKILRHSCSHIMAHAVKRLYPEVKLAIGPSTDDGFYYDFDGKNFELSDLEKIEKVMRDIILESHKIERFTLGREKAFEIMYNEPYKVELINNLPEDSEIIFYRQDSFIDLCSGPHLNSTNDVDPNSFKLINLAGAYWRGDEKNKMLTRIYGTAFFNENDLKKYLEFLEQSKLRDHRKLGKKLELFMLSDESIGMPFFLPNGQIIKNNLVNFWREIHEKNNYQEISTPLILNKNLWIRSGHWDHYKNNMYFTKIDDLENAVKPMNCPGSILVYKLNSKSYRDLPIRLAELGLVHRHEKSGTLHGLMRARCFTQDDAHIFVSQEQIQEEIKKIIDIISKVYKIFGFNFFIELSTRPENSMGDDLTWEEATKALEISLREKKLDFKINEGDGAFYGPKIDFHIKDCINRNWQCGTIQLDFQMPEKFDLEYIGNDNKKHRPIMIHRVIFGSVERFIGILIEHYGGNFPLWISPMQVKILTISEKFNSYAQSIQENLKKNNIRSELDIRQEKIGYKIREAILKKVNYIVIIGDNEEKNNIISIRTRDKINKEFKIDDFLNKLKKEILERL